MLPLPLIFPPALFEVSLEQKDQRKIQMGPGVIWRDPEHMPVDCYCLLRPAGARQSVGQIDVGLGITGGNRERRTISLNRLIQASPQGKIVSQVIRSRGIARD